MIGLDTNVIIRFLTQDEPKQAEIINKLIDKAINNNEVFWISQLTLCETVWVLERAYKISKKELVNILGKILKTNELKLERSEVIHKALDDYIKSKNVRFVDCLIGQSNQNFDCIFTYTFDKDTAKDLASFRLL